jgi:xylulokinase
MGTSSIKASLVDETGLCVESFRRPASVMNPREGFFEVDPEAVWWSGFVSVCREALSVVDAADISALCVSSVCGSFVPVTPSTYPLPLRSAILYGIDRRSASIASELNSLWGEDFLKKKLGGAFTTHSIFPKILWLKRNEPDIYEAARFVSSFNFVSARLTGVASWDYPTAFGGLMLDAETLSYPEWFLRRHGIDLEKLPPLGPGVGVLGAVTAAASMETGLREGTRVMRGACDVNAEAMAVGAVAPGTAAAVFGSTMSLLLNTEQPVPVDGFVPGVSLMPGVWRVGAATASGGLTMDWIRKIVGDRVVKDGAPTGIMFIPYLDGARTPFNDPAASGAFLGLRSSHGPDDLARAVGESLGYELAMLIEIIERSYSFPEILDVSGGLTHINWLMRVVADVTGRTLRVHEHDASFGDARIAMLADTSAGLLPSPVPAATVEPGPRSSEYRPYRSEFARSSFMYSRRNLGV